MSYSRRYLHTALDCEIRSMRITKSLIDFLCDTRTNTANKTCQFDQKRKKERKEKEDRKKTSISRLTKFYGVYVKNGVINVNVRNNKMTAKLSTTLPSKSS